MSRTIRYSASDPTYVERLLDKVTELADSGRANEALALLTNFDLQSPELLNATGVCLMRCERYDDAIRVFRSYQMAAGGIRTRDDLPNHHRCNFALALGLSARVGGMSDVLNEIGNPDDADVVRTRAILNRWTASLSWTGRLGWWLGVAPDVPLAVDGPIGTFRPAAVTEQVTAKTA